MAFAAVVLLGLTSYVVADVDIVGMRYSTCPTAPDEAVIGWQVDPESELNTIRSFKFEYREASINGEDGWLTETVGTGKPIKVELHNMKPDTEYELRITPVYHGRSESGASSFIMKTAAPRPVSPVAGIKVSYRCYQRDVTKECQRTLIWELAPTTDKSQIYRTIVRHTQNEELDEDSWSLLEVKGNSQQVDITNLPDGETLFRIYPNLYSGNPKFTDTFAIVIQVPKGMKLAPVAAAKQTGSLEGESCNLNQATPVKQRPQAPQVPTAPKQLNRQTSSASSRSGSMPPPMTLKICKKVGRDVKIKCEDGEAICITHPSGLGAQITPPWGVCVPKTLEAAIKWNS